MHFSTIFLTPYLLVVELETKLVTHLIFIFFTPLIFIYHMDRRSVANGFLSLVICQPRPQPFFMT